MGMPSVYLLVLLLGDELLYIQRDPKASIVTAMSNTSSLWQITFSKIKKAKQCA